MSEVRLREITERLGGELIGDGAIRIASVGPLETATASTIAFLSNPRYARQLAGSKAGCVIVAPAFRDEAAARGAAIVSDDPYLYFARLTQWWAERIRPRPERGIHASAVVDASAQLGADVSIGAFAMIESGAILGDGVTIGAHAFVGRDCRIGAGTRLAPRVTVLFETTLGARCFLQPGAVIGADGFGFASDHGCWVKIEQLGRVVIGDDVEIGANSCVDRGATGDTVIGDGVKIDNLVQIGHNVRIGAHTAIAGCVGIAGSAVIGAHCMIGGGAGVSGHVTIVDRVVVSAATQITSSIRQPGIYSGLFPFDDNAAWEKNAATLRHLHALRGRVRALEKKVAMKMDIHDILKRLPHRYPFLLVDRVVELEHGKRIVALKNVTINEPYFVGHFPLRPVMPGVMMLEALAQAAALLSFDALDAAPDDKRLYYFAGIDSARFKRPVEPGDQLLLDVTLLRMKSGIFKFSARATVDGELAVEAALMCAVRSIE